MYTEELEDLKQKDVIDNLINIIATSRSVSKSMAKKLLLNALTYNWIINSIEEQVGVLLGDEL